MNYELLENILQNKNYNIDEIKTLLNADNNDVLTQLLTMYKKILYTSKRLKKKKKIILNNIVYYSLLICENYDNKNNKQLIGMNKSILNKLQQIIKYKSKNEFYLNLYNNTKHLQAILLNKNSIKESNEFNFLIQIIRDIESVEAVRQVVNKYSHFVNLRDESNTHIIIYIAEMFNKSINNDDPIDKITYYEKILELFLDIERIQLTDDDTNKLTEIICNSSISNEKNNNKEDKKYRKINSFIESIKIKSIESDISRMNLETLKEKYDINAGFSNEAIKEMNIILYKNNKNINNPIITIDGDGTTCFDDAFLVEDVNGGYIINVYISNLANQIPLNCALDIEASKKFSNIYLSNSTITMFPSELSNNIMSLNTNGYKSVIEYKIHFDKSWNLLDCKISSKKVHIDRNLTYDYVNSIINNDCDNNYGLEYSLNILSDLSMYLRSKNTSKEPYRKTSDIIKILSGRTLDKNIYENRTKSEIIVEELMILVNYLSAYCCRDKKYPYIYRINNKIENTDVYKKIIEIANSQNLSNISKSLSGYAKSKYSTKADKHEGLNIEIYSHSTSPLRRYVDVVNQRILFDLVINEKKHKIEFWNKYVDENIDLFNKRDERNNGFLEDAIKYKSLTKTRR